MRETAREHYRRMAVESASPAGLIGLLFEGAVSSLHGAALAAAAGQVARRLEHTNRALGIITHLRNSLELERGGRVAATLRDFYSLAIPRILQAGIQNSAAMFTELETEFAGLREAWRAVERDEARGFRPAAAAGARRG